MSELPRSHLLAYAAAALVVAALGARQIAHSRASEGPRATGPAPIAVRPAGGSEGGRVVVHVAGAVRRPGVYRLHAGARVDEAVRRAGGTRPRADLTQLNLAAKLEDGRQVLVPVRTPVGAGATTASAPNAPSAGPLNLNTATLEQLDTLDGVGPATAQKILGYRTEHDGFGSVEELGRIPGIGERRLASLREQVRV